MRIPRWSIAIRLAIFAVLAAGIQSCTQDVAGPRDFAPPPLEVGKPGGGGGDSTEVPVVLSVDPSVVTQDTIVELTISGENFEPGAIVEFLIDTVVSGKLTATDVKVSKNGRSLTARLTVEADAEVAFYNIAITIGRGRRGIGTQLLQVKTNSKPAGPIDMSLTMPTGVISGYTNELDDDGDGPYVGGECGVTSELAELGATSNFSDMRYSFRAPNGDHLKGKALREAEASCEEEGTTFPRDVWINITGNTKVHTGARHDDPNPDNLPKDVLLSTLVGTGVGQPQNPGVLGTRSGSFSAWIPRPDTETIDTIPNIPRYTYIWGERSSFNAPYCMVPGGGPPMIFTTTREPDSDDLLFSFEGDFERDGFTVSTRPYPDNVGHCTSFDSNGDVVVLLLHLDLSYTVSR